MKLLLFTQLPVILVSFDEVGHKKTRLISIMSKPISIVVEVVVVVKNKYKVLIDAYMQRD